MDRSSSVSMPSNADFLSKRLVNKNHPRKMGILSLLVAAFLFPFYVSVSLWVFPVVWITVFVTLHMCSSLRLMVPFPHVAVLLACLQYGIAAWLSHYFPPDYKPYHIGDRLPEYFSYVGPVIITFAIGVYVGFVGLKLKKIRSRNQNGLSKAPNAKISKELDLLIVIGLAAAASQNVVPPTFKFASVLLSNVAFVGAFGFILLKLKGWKIRLGIVFVMLINKSLAFGMFHDLAIWSASSVLIIGFSGNWNKKKALSIIALGIFSLMVLLNVKEEYRKQFWFGTEYIAKTRVEAFTTLVGNILTNPLVLFSEDNLGETLLRLNQGWIVNRAMIWTPQFEPFARGQTIADSIIGALVPRVIYAGKSVVGGKDDYERFTGRRLTAATSMNLGYAGEMYVNFGAIWGVVGVGLYGFLIGLGFQWFYAKAFLNPLWWAWAAYFAGIAIKAESSIGYVANWMIKSLVIMIGILWFTPNLRLALGLRNPVK